MRESSIDFYWNTLWQDVGDTRSAYIKYNGSYNEHFGKKREKNLFSLKRIYKKLHEEKMEKMLSRVFSFFLFRLKCHHTHNLMYVVNKSRNSNYLRRILQRLCLRLRNGICLETDCFGSSSK